MRDNRNRIMLREVLGVSEGYVTVNISGAVFRDRIIGKATPF